MEDLIKALQIFAKYQPATKWPTNCSHDEMAIMGVNRSMVSDEDHAKLDELGFFYNDDEEYYLSFRFGSA